MDKKDLTKATNNDKRRYLSKELPGEFWLLDWDDEYVYFDKYNAVEDTIVAYKAPYVLDGVNASIDIENKSEVEEETVYTEKQLEGVVTRLFHKLFGDSQEQGRKVIKMFDDEEMVVVEPLYVAYGDIDAHNETYLNKEAVYQLVDSFNESIEENILKSSYFHTHETTSFKSVRAWVNKEESMLGDNLIPAMQPLVEVQFTNKAAFELRKEKDLLGVSIGCKAIPHDSKGVEVSKDAYSERDTSKDAVTYLSDFNFMYEGAHLAYTDASTGGAASLNNEYYAIKTKLKANLSEEQKRILEESGEDFMPLDKSVESIPSSVIEEDSTGEDKIKTENGNSENTMTEEEMQKQADLEKANQELLSQVAKFKRDGISKDLQKYGFEAELCEEVADLFVAVSEDQVDVLTKAFDAIEGKLEQVQADLKKAREDAKEQDDLEKSLEKEQGYADDEPAEQAPTSLKDRVKAAQAKLQDKESK